MNKFKLEIDNIYNKKAKKDIVIAHFADLHFSIKTQSKELDKLYKCIQNINPSYIMITGDIIDMPDIIKNEKINKLQEFLEKLAKIAKVLISLGNHDISRHEDYNFFKNLAKINNVYVLDNEYYYDEFISVLGITLPPDYYYNITGFEPKELLLDFLNNKKEVLKKAKKDTINIALVHSPIRLSEDDIIDKFSNFDLILSGHTHNGMVPKWLYFLFRKNIGIYSPTKEFFPKMAKGKFIKEINNKKTTVIINGGITKLSYHSGIIFRNLNFLYNKSINKIIIRKEEENE